MTFEEALKVIKTTLYNNKRKQLTVIEKEILKAAWENETYATTAKNSHLSVGHIKDVAYKLWKQLSEILGEKVTKTNLRMVLQKNSVTSNTCPPRKMLTFRSYKKKSRNLNKPKKSFTNPAHF